MRRAGNQGVSGGDEAGSATTCSTGRGRPLGRDPLACLLHAAGVAPDQFVVDGRSFKTARSR